MEETGKFTKQGLSEVLGSVTRWTMLEELSKGGTYEVAELARAAGVSGAAASKHMLLLKRAGIVVQGKGRLYELAPGVSAEGRELRMGMCTLRFGKAAGEP